MIRISYIFLFGKAEKKFIIISIDKSQIKMTSSPGTFERVKLSYTLIIFFGLFFIFVGKQDSH